MGWTIGCVVVALLLAVVAGSLVRTEADRIAAAEVELDVRVHRVRRLTRVWILSCYLVGLFLGGVALANAGHGGARPAVGWLALVVCLLGPVVAVRQGTRPVIAQLRGIPVRVAGNGRRIAAALVSYAVFVAFVFGAGALGPDHGAGAVVASGIGLVLGLVATQAVAPVVLAIVGAQQLPPELAARLRPLAERVGCGGLRMRVLPDRGQRVANAAQMGVLPGLRYVVFTSYAVDELTPDELDAVAAHELGHAREQHLTVKLAAVVATYAAIEALVAWVARDGSGLLAYALALVGIPLALIVVSGVSGLPLENRADATAAREVGPQHLASALARLGELNHTPLRTGSVWNAFHGHPGLSQRIERLGGAGRVAQEENGTRS